MIRPIQSKDNRAHRAVVREVLESFGANREGFAYVDPELDDMYEAYSSERSQYCVLELDGAIVGGGGIGPLEGAPSEYSELKKMYFAESARGHGWGRRMIEQCLEDARAFGYRYCYLETLETMDAAKHLYLDYGWSPRTQPFGDTGHGGCDVWMMKEL